MLTSKSHRAAVRQAHLHDIGSVTVDADQVHTGTDDPTLAG